MANKKHFRAWYVTLPIAVIATVIFADVIIENWAMMQEQENPFAAIGLMMVYAYYIGIAMIVGLIAWILTFIFIAKKI